MGNKKIIIFYLGIIMFVVFFMFENKHSKNSMYEYEKFTDISKEAGAYSWLPDFFPINASKITIFTDVESDSFYSDLTLDNYSSEIFDRTFTVKTSPYGVKYIDKNVIVDSWCQESDSIDDENRDRYNSLYIIAKLPDNRYHISLVTRGKNNMALNKAKNKYCITR